MSAVDRRFTLHIDDHIEEDIDDVYNESEEKGDNLVAFLEELKGDIWLCERLVDAGYSDEQIEAVKPFAALQAQGYNAYTVRVAVLYGWRLISGVDHRQRIIAILYIMDRNEDYGQVAQKRVAAAYERLQLKRLGHH